jgi:hypothetical protein
MRHGDDKDRMEVDSDVAAFYQAAPPEDRSKLSVLWQVLLREYRTCPPPLRQLMDEVGAKARARGLTSGVLESINEDS